MKLPLPGNQPSYRNHRRQFWLQIFLPMFVTVLLVIAVAILTGLAAFGEDGEAPRWAAISTIWLVIPVMIFGLLLLAILVSLIYLLARTLKVIPPYAAKAQYYINRGTSTIKRFSDLAAKPVLYLEGLIASLKAFLGRN